MKHRTRVKICGITRLQDALDAEALGADAIGFVFVPASRRHVDIDTAAELSRQLGPLMQRVGLFLDADEHQVKAACQAIPGLLPQFHGTESPEWCDHFDRPYIKAISAVDGQIESESLSAYRHAAAFLFDSNTPGGLGGTGHVFDWTRVPERLGRALILAGGLQADNVGVGIERLAPYAVDVSSGVELSPGIKQRDLLERFMAAVQQADRRRLQGRE